MMTGQTCEGVVYKPEKSVPPRNRMVISNAWEVTAARVGRLRGVFSRPQPPVCKSFKYLDRCMVLD